MGYESRMEAAAVCELKADIAERSSKAAVEYALECQCRNAWDMVDAARLAARAALQAHEQLQQLAGEDMSDREREAFERAEIVQSYVALAENAAKTAVDIVFREAWN